MAVTMAATLVFGIVTEVQAAAGAQGVSAAAGQAADSAGIVAYSDTTVDEPPVTTQRSTYSVSMDSDSVDDMMKHFSLWNNGLFGALLLSLVMFVLAPVAVLALLFYFIYKSRKQKMRLAEMAMEKGQPIPGTLVREQLEPVEVIWRKGIKNVSVGLGLACLFYFMDFDLGIGVGLLLGFYGAGQIVIARTSAARKDKAEKADDYEEMKD